MGGNLAVGTDGSVVVDELDGSPGSSARAQGMKAPLAAVSSASGATRDLNNNLMSRIQKAKEDIVGHQDMGNAGNSAALPLPSRDRMEITMTSAITPYDDEAGTACLTTSKAYGPVGFNIFHLDLHGNRAKRAHVNLSKLNSLVGVVFQNGFKGAFPPTFTATVSATDAVDPISTKFGSLATTSPAEIIWAVILGAAKLLETSPLPDNVAVLDRALLAFPVAFKIVEPGPPG